MATEADLAAICDLYNYAVRETTAIWNDQEVDLENRKAWFAARKARGFPVLVASIDSRFCGYAAYGDWRAFDGFRHSVEHSIYVTPDHKGRGIGTALMQALITRARASGLHVMIAAIAAENHASIALHTRLGFRHVGTHHEVGLKFGRWLDLTMMELRL